MRHDIHGRHAVGSLRLIRRIRPCGDPERQVHDLIRSDALSARYVLVHIEDEQHEAYAFFDALDRFVLDKKNKKHAQQMPLGFIKVTPDTLHVLRNYVTGVTPPEFPIACVQVVDGDIQKHVHRLVHGDNGRGGLAADKYILLSATGQDREEVPRTEEFITRLNAEVALVTHQTHMRRTLGAYPLGLIVYTMDVLSCWENYAHWGIPRA